MDLGLLNSLFLVFVLHPLFSNACSCTPTHPQVQFCKADYAIKVLILSSKLVHFDEYGNLLESKELDGKVDKVPPPLVSDPELIGPPAPSVLVPEVPQPGPIIEELQHLEHPKLVISELQPISEEQPVLLSPPDSEELQPVILPQNNSEEQPVLLLQDGNEEENTLTAVDTDVYKSESGPQTIMQNDEPARSLSSVGYDVPNLEQPEMDAGSSSSNLHVHITTSSHHKSRKNRRKSKKNKRRNKRNNKKKQNKRVRRQAIYAGNFAPGENVPGQPPVAGLASPSFSIPYTQYEVKILKVFKGELTEMDHTFIYTPPSGGLCGLNLDIDESYLIMGSFRNNKLQLDICDFKLHMDLLNATESRHLTNVMNHVYGKQCGECELLVCYNREKCEHSEKPYRCIWENVYTLLDYRAYEFVCVRKKQANPPKCEWHNSLNTKMQPKDLN